MEFTAMNQLAEKYGDRVAILGFPCNQFGDQNNVKDDEFLNFLKYVRPGKGFEPRDSITIFEKTEVNGANAAPVFKWMKRALLSPTGGEEGGVVDGCADDDVLILPHESAMEVQGRQASVAMWQPVCRSDIAWNFEKFLFDAEGKPVRRYSRFFSTIEIANDLDALLENIDDD